MVSTSMRRFLPFLLMLFLAAPSAQADLHVFSFSDLPESVPLGSGIFAVFDRDTHLPGQIAKGMGAWPGASGWGAWAGA